MIRLSGSVKLYWSPGSGVGVGGLGWLAANLFAALLLGGAFGQFLFVLGQLGGVTDMRASLDLGAGLRQRGLALLPTRDFIGNRQPVLQRRGVGLFGLGQKLLHFQFE